KAGTHNHKRSDIALPEVMESGLAPSARPGMAKRELRPRNHAALTSMRDLWDKGCVTGLDRRRNHFFHGWQRQIGPMQPLVFKSVLDGRLHHGEIGRDIEIARRVERMMPNLQQL